MKQAYIQFERKHTVWTYCHFHLYKRIMDNFTITFSMLWGLYASCLKVLFLSAIRNKYFVQFTVYKYSH